MSRLGTSAIRLRRTVALCALTLGSVVASVLPAACAEPPALQFLSIGVGARAAAMGDAVVSNVQDASAAYWNPGGIALPGITQVELVHNQTFDLARYEFASVTRGFGRHGVGVAFHGLWTDPLKRYDNDGNAQLSDFNYTDAALSGEYSYALAPNVGIGAGAEYLREVIDTSVFTGAAFSFGIQARDILPETNLGLAVLHLGSDMKFAAGSYPLPTRIQGGVSHRFGLGAVNGHLLLSAEVRKNRDQSAQMLFGTEYEYRDVARLQVGYQGGVDTQDLSFGVGAGNGRIRGEYSFSPLQENLGTSQRIALLLRF
jgi:hypothetical protein